MARNAKNLTIKTSIDASNDAAMTPRTEASTPGHSLGTQTPATPVNVRGRSDLRSPGISKTPTTDHPNANSNANSNADAAQDPVAANNNNAKDDAVPLPDFMTQTDRYGNATTPRNLNANGVIQETNTDETEKDSVPAEVQVDACDTLLESLRMMCCCILPESSQVDNDQKDTTSKNSSQPHKSHAYYPYNNNNNNGNNNGNANNNNHSNSQTAIMSPKQIVKDDVEGSHNIRLLPQITKGDNWFGKKCLVLDLDETLVHSSFRAVPGADFVIPVQIEDIVHFVYVMKRPGVDEFLIEMAKHYEIVIYTASLNKYADPLLDLLDPQQTIRYRLFRESCVYYEGSYVKDLSLLNRDLSQTIIIDNSPASYIFHPENAIDCSSFIDDPADRELLQIGSFLKGIKNVENVRGLSNMWRDWPRIPNVPRIEFPGTYDEEERQIAEHVPVQV